MYIVARVNPTAFAFVAAGYKAKDNPDWIILDQSDSYKYACNKRDALNSASPLTKGAPHETRY